MKLLDGTERRSELEISDEITSCRERLEALLDERKGRAVDGNRGLGWCCRCGNATVDLDEGEHTCVACLSNVTPTEGWTSW